MPTVTRRRFVVGICLAAAIPVLQACRQASPSTAPPTSQPAPASAPTAASAAAPATAAAPASNAAPAANATPATTAAPVVSSGVELQVATRGATDGDIMENSVVTFLAQTGIKFKHVSYGPEPDYWSKVQALHATGQIADVVWASTGNLHNFANRGILAELDPLIAADKYDMSDYVPAGLQSMSLNGKLYGMPWGGHPGNGGLLYNVDMLNAAGFNVTEDPDSLQNWTYETLKDAAAKTTRTTNGRPDAFGYSPGTDFLSLNNVLGAYGARFMTPDGKNLAMDTPEFLAAMSWVRDIFSSKASPAPGPDATATANTNNELFASSKLAMLQSQYAGMFSPGEKVIQGKFKWNVGLQPTGPAGKRGTALTINGMTIAAKSKHKDEAWQFVKWLMEPENQVPIILAGGSRPALRTKVLNNPRLMTELKAHKVFAKALLEAEPWQMPANYRWPEFNSTVIQVFAGVWAGTDTLEQAMPQAKKKLQDIIDKPAID
jgi:multiple sugar transport system substrate-binding protein